MSDTTPTPVVTKSPSNGLAYAIMAVAFAIVAGLIVLTLSGHEVDRYIEFATFLIPLLIMQIWTASRVNIVQNQVNGNLTQRLANVANDIKAHVTSTASPINSATVDTTRASVDENTETP